LCCWHVNCQMSLSEMLVNCGIFLNDTVFHEAKSKILLFTARGFFVHSFGLWYHIVIGGYQSLGVRSSCADVDEDFDVLECYAVWTDKQLLKFGTVLECLTLKMKTLRSVNVSVNYRYSLTYEQDKFWIHGCKLNRF
jgi:hypothetical protein